MTEKSELQAAPDYTPRQRILTGFFTIFLLSVLLYSAVQLARFGLMLGEDSPWLRDAQFALSGLIAFAALYWIFVMLRRKWKTGRFLHTRTEALARAAEYSSKMGACKPFLPQAKYWIAPLVIMAVLLGLGILAIAASTCACGDGSSLRLRLLLLALAATIMFLPGWFVFKSIRRKLKTGSLLPSEEELAKSRAECAAPKPLRQRILLAGMYWLIAILWTIPVFRSHHHSASQIVSPWFLASLWWFAAALWTWQVFRPSKPRCALSITPQEDRVPPEALPH